ncbi:hypothetical protein TeGR_g6631, partial [Tetraparma gracilis]
SPPPPLPPPLSPPVSSLVSRLSSPPSPPALLETFESLGSLISSGADVGGSVSFLSNPGMSSVSSFDTGEDSSIYNPGLSLLSDDEKQALVASLRSLHNNPLLDKPLETDRAYLLSLLDPLRLSSLAPYLHVLPLAAAGAYSLALAAMVFAREVFPALYVGIAAAALVLPIGVLLVFNN